MAEPLPVRAQLRAEFDNPLALDFNRREKDGVPLPGDPKNTRLALFRMKCFAARERFHEIDRVHLVRETVTFDGHSTSGHRAMEPLSPAVIADLRMDISRAYGFLPSKALVKDVLHDVARGWDVKWSQEKGTYLE